MRSIMVKRISILVSVIRILPVWTVSQLVGGQCIDRTWTDNGGDGCGWYEARPTYCKDGHLVNQAKVRNYAKNGVSAADACCVCGGGNEAPTIDPATKPVVCGCCMSK